MERIKYSILLLLICFLFTSLEVSAQMSGLFGTDGEFKRGEHAGNLFRITFYNDGTLGDHNNDPGAIDGEWPINSAHIYLIDGNLFVGSEVIDDNGDEQNITSTVKSSNEGGSKGDTDPITGDWWTFLPLPGFNNREENKIAMEKGTVEWGNSWPLFWPDISDPANPRYSPDGWAGDWNGYFGRNKFNADEESYFIADDYENREWQFTPDETNPNRGGLGIRFSARGLQWAKQSVQDALFILYDFTNIGTYKHDKIVFGYKMGNNMGDTFNNDDTGDDHAAYSVQENIAYMWDDDDIGASDWGTDPVGYFGGAFLESPGNSTDGIDNDNDGVGGSGDEIKTDMFDRGELTMNTTVVTIDYTTFERSAPMKFSEASGGSESLDIKLGGKTFTISVGDTLLEIGDNLFDDNLNGIIDENRGVRGDDGLVTYIYINGNGTGNKYVNYLSGAINTNPMLDEKRDDGIDNDGDWVAEFDDTGADGLLPGDKKYPGPDVGERDGIPSDGEPHFDLLDINESDMVGLTSVYLYEWSGFRQDDDEAVWNALAPGRLMETIEPSNTELMFGSGYFPLHVGQTERFSMAIIAGIDFEDILRNKNNVEQAYEENYNFAKAPTIPKVDYYAGDNSVTLFWDASAEDSEDPISGKDFEGYKIYRSTDPAFSEMNPITDAYGSSITTPLFQKPIEMFDLDNEYSGLAEMPTNGVHFWLGNNTGLKHFWTDTTAVNGYDYFYAVTSFDHGDPGLGIDPSECTKYVAIKADGTIEKGTNVVVARPEAPAAGYIEPQFENNEIVQGSVNTSDGFIEFLIVNPRDIRHENNYEVTFKDTVAGGNDSTLSFTLANLTTGEIVIKDSPYFSNNDKTESLDGFQLTFQDNEPYLDYNADSSSWNNTGIVPILFNSYSYRKQPVKLIASDFEIVFGDIGMGTSTQYFRGSTELPAIPVNFFIENLTTGGKVDFAFRERHSEDGEEGIFSFNPNNRRTDEIILLTKDNLLNDDSVLVVDSTVASWQLRYDTSVLEDDTLKAGPGDALTIATFKPYLSHDVFRFKTIGANIDSDLAKADLDKIRVVPNPYIVSNSWEPQNQYANGRGERELHFTHLPAECTIRIFNIRGQLVNTIQHNEALNDGTEIWNMLSKDNLEISYGIYIYHVDAKDVGEKIGKFVLIK